MSHEGYKNETIKSPEELEADRLTSCIYGLDYYVSERKLPCLTEVAEIDSGVGTLETKKIENAITNEEYLAGLREILERVRGIAISSGVPEGDVTDEALMGYFSMKEIESSLFEERRARDRNAGLSPEHSLLKEIFRDDKEN